jgi:hypothetical protein
MSDRLRETRKELNTRKQLTLQDKNNELGIKKRESTHNKSRYKSILFKTRFNATNYFPDHRICKRSGTDSSGHSGSKEEMIQGEIDLSSNG